MLHAGVCSWMASRLTWATRWFAIAMSPESMARPSFTSSRKNSERTSRSEGGTLTAASLLNVARSFALVGRRPFAAEALATAVLSLQTALKSAANTRELTVTAPEAPRLLDRLSPQPAETAKASSASAKPVRCIREGNWSGRVSASPSPMPTGAGVWSPASC